MRFAGDQLGGGFSALGTQAGPDFSGMSENFLAYRGKEREAVHAAESQVNQYGLKSIADIRSAELEAEATKNAGQQAGQSAMVGGAINGVAGLASAGIQKWGAPGGATQNSLTAPLSTGTSALSKLSEFLQR